MRNLFMMLALLPTLALVSCHKHTKILRVEEGQPGASGEDGVDGENGSYGLGFDYVRGMDGASVCEGVVVIPAQYVVPESILALAPAEDPYDPDGLTLTFGTIDSPIRFYLGMMMAGEYCVVEKVRGEGWSAIGEQLVFGEAGFVAIVPFSMVPYLDPNVILDHGVVVEFPVKCKTLDYSRHRLSIGDNIRVYFNRD